jgi:hypothetical protein
MRARNRFWSAHWYALANCRSNEAASLTSDDQAILDAYVGGELKRRGNETDPAPVPGEDDAD